MSKNVVFTGIRANNDLHIGNYLGALLPMVDMARNKAEDNQVIMMLADLHSFSTPIDHDVLSKQIHDNLRVFVAAGLPIDHDNVFLFRESYISAHSELAHLLDCFTGVGEMMRMTQFKDKSAKLGTDRVSMGLLNYPPLMAADILLYQANYIPVGDDQSQHLEYTRDIAERLNKKFSEELFVIPEPVKKQHAFFGKDQGLRIKDLVDPTKKMSKSDESGKGIIFMSDDPEVAAKKIMSATTDSLAMITYDPIKQPGIANLIDIYVALSGKSLVEVMDEYKGQNQYGPLKQAVATAVKDFLINFQSRLAAVDERSLATKLEASEKALRAQANQTLSRVQVAIGLREK